jgi:AcrR family transcriptional regulator
MATARTRMSREDRRIQLLDSAEQVFVQLGVDGASMEDVAERAGVTKPVLYDHFGSKDGLLTALLGRLGDRMLDETAAAAAEATSAQEALSQGLTAYFRFVDRHEGAWLLLMREVGPGTAAAQEADRVRNAQVAAIAALVQVHLPRADALRCHTYAHVVSGASERLAAVRLTQKRMTAAKASALLMEVLWQGFAQLQADANQVGKSR